MTDKPYGAGETAWFVKDRFGMFIHWGLYAQGARHEWLKKIDALQLPLHLWLRDRP